MREPPRILVGADAGEQAAEAVRQGDAWARAHGWRLLVCHVAPSPLGVHMLFPQRTEQDLLAQPELEQSLDRLLREHVAGLTGRAPGEIETFIATGTPDRELVREAEDRSAELVVVGSHSHSALKHVFLGDVAESIVRHAHCSVLVARPHATTRRILAATDFSSGSTPAVALAAEHARRVGARLTVACSIERQMRVAREMTSFGATYGFVEHELADLREKARARLAEQLEAVAAHAETLVLEGKPAAAIVQAAVENDADLVVVGASGASGLRRLLLGSVAERVVRATPCSVLVARAARQHGARRD